MPCTRLAKYVAKLMVIIWLFGLAVSVAHACVVSAATPASSVAVAHEDQEPDPCAQACESFCDSERSTVAKSQSAKALDSHDAAPSLAATLGWQIGAAALTDAAWQRADVPPRRLTLAIQYRRLTL